MLLGIKTFPTAVSCSASNLVKCHPQQYVRPQEAIVLILLKKTFVELIFNSSALLLTPKLTNTVELILKKLKINFQLF
jgi:hypothetical protein